MSQHFIRALALGFLAISLSGCKVWGPLSSTYSGNVVVRGQGYASVSSTSARDTIKVKDPLRDGNTVYGHVAFSFYKYRCNAVDQCATQWVAAGTKTTPEIADQEHSYLRTWALDRDALKVRMATRVCAQMGWPVPDSCSNDAIVTFDY